MNFAHTAVDQSGSFFDDQKIGFHTNLQYNHDTGKFLAGLNPYIKCQKE